LFLLAIMFIIGIPEAAAKLLVEKTAKKEAKHSSIVDRGRLA